MGEGEGRDPRAPGRLFVSHAAEDKELAAALSALVQAAFDLRRSEVFLSTAHGQRIQPGQPWAAKLQAEMRRTTLVLVLVTPDYLASTYCAIELGAFWVLDTPMVPILVGLDAEASIPAPLAAYEYVEPDEAAPDRIVEAIRTHRPGLTVEGHHPQGQRFLAETSRRTAAPLPPSSPPPDGGSGPRPRSEPQVAAGRRPGPPVVTTRVSAGPGARLPLAPAFDAVAVGERVALITSIDGPVRLLEQRDGTGAFTDEEVSFAAMGPDGGHPLAVAAGPPDHTGTTTPLVATLTTGHLYLRNAHGRWAQAQRKRVLTQDLRTVTPHDGPAATYGIAHDGRLWRMYWDGPTTPLAWKVMPSPDDPDRFFTIAQPARLIAGAADGTAGHHVFAVDRKGQLWAGGPTLTGLTWRKLEHVGEARSMAELSEEPGHLALYLVDEDGALLSLHGEPEEEGLVRPLAPFGRQPPTPVVRVAACSTGPGSQHLFVHDEDGQVRLLRRSSGRWDDTWATVG